MDEAETMPIPEELLPLPEGIDEDDVTGIIYDGDTPVGIALREKKEEE